MNEKQISENYTKLKRQVEKEILERHVGNKANFEKEMSAIYDTNLKNSKTTMMLKNECIKLKNDSLKLNNNRIFLTSILSSIATLALVFLVKQFST